MAIANSIEELLNLTRDELAARWGCIFGHSPPKGVKRRFLERGLAYCAQCRLLGGLKRKTKRQLESCLLSDAPPKPSKQSDQPALGTRFVREWRGKSYTVDVLEKGFCFNGNTYRSLSAIAREITGTRWSGPRFFGL